MNEVNYLFIRKWIEKGAPDIDTLCAMVGIYSLNLIKIISGKISADSETKERLAAVLECKIEDIFPVKSKSR